MLQYRQCKIKYRNGMSGTDAEALLRKKIARQLHVPEDRLRNVTIVRQSLDARKKPDLYYDFTVIFECGKEKDILQKNRKNKNLSTYEAPPDLMDFVRRQKRGAGEDKRESVVIVGSGPAGLMCGYFLALCGKRPVIIERGGPMWERVDKVAKFWRDGTLDADTNVSFGEGGAGTFSDGKLNTGVKDKTGKKKFVLDTFIKHGAPEEIGYAAKPHIGTDELRGVIQSMRATIEECGGTYLFHTCLTGFAREGGGKLAGICVTDGEGNERVIACDSCVLAIGHSARDTFQMLKAEGIQMEQKPFAVGVRVMHPQKKINEIQYGTGEEGLPAADYKLTGTVGDGRGVYSFCMCPGGYVVNASTEEGMTAVNGMSNHARDSKSANSAILVTVRETDFGSGDVLAGVEIQRELERKTFLAGRGKIPVQRYGDFVTGTVSGDLDRFSPSVKGQWVSADVKNILPSFIADGIIEGMEQFGVKMKGFDDGDTLVLGTETRTSSPVRIVRNRELVSGSLDGLYPCGEGAGYAGGIMSAAMDGLRVALQIAGERSKDNEKYV